MGVSCVTLERYLYVNVLIHDQGPMSTFIPLPFGQLLKFLEISIYYLEFEQS